MTILPLISIQPNSELPIYRQIMRQIIEGIASQRLLPGEQLPSLRDLAGQLVVAPLTVKKAYDELEKLGLIETQRGRGTFVSASPPLRPNEETKKRLQELAGDLARSSIAGGVALEDLLEILRTEYKTLDRSKGSNRHE